MMLGISLATVRLFLPKTEFAWGVGKIVPQLDKVNISPYIFPFGYFSLKLLITVERDNRIKRSRSASRGCLW
jgi:hypothetical protein